MSKTRESNIIRTKLHRPPASDDLLLRDHLIERLEKNRYKPLTLVVAPAGFGKSMIISQWIDEQNLVNAWVSLDQEHITLYTFLKYLSAALSNIFPNKKQEFYSLTQARVIPSLNTIATTFLNEIDDSEKEFVLVLDDYQYIKDDQIHEFINAILNYLPQNMHLVIITRRDPPLKIAALRAYNRVTDIRSKQLAFSKNDIQLLFKKSYNRILSDKTAELLTEHTEGWIVGIRLAILSVNNEEEAEHLLANFRGDFFGVSEFILAEILNKETEEMQKLVITSGLFDMFCAELLDEVMPGLMNTNQVVKKGEEFIDWLLKSNLFIIPLDAEGKWFRYNHFFQELLQKQHKKRKYLNTMDRFHFLVSAWFEKNMYIKEAIKHAIIIEDYELAADILVRQKPYLYKLDDWKNLDQLLIQLPSDIIDQRIPLLLIKLMITSGRFDMEGMKPLLDKCERLFEEDPAEDDYYGEWCYHKGFFTSYTEEDQTEVLKYFIKALEFLPTEPMSIVRAETELQLQITRHMTGEGRKALNHINDRLSHHYDKQGILWERMMFGLSAIHLMDGKLSFAYREALALNDYTIKNNLAYVETWASSILGIICLHKFNLKEAKYYFERVVKLQYIAFDRVAVDSIIGLAITYHFLGEQTKSKEMMEVLFKYASWSKNPDHLLMLNAGEARLNLLCGKNLEALNWLSTFDVSIPISSMVYFFTNPSITACRVSLAQGSNEKIKKTVEELEKYLMATTNLHYNCQSIEIKVLLALGYEKLGNKQKAFAILKKTLKITALNEWVRPYVECGPILISLLDELQKNEPLKDELSHIKIIKEAYNTFYGNVNLEDGSSEEIIHDIKAETVSVSTPVSRREHEIITLVSQGFRNKEVANKLYISENTVKKHLYNIYQKFEIHNRTSLVDKFKKQEISKES